MRTAYDHCGAPEERDTGQENARADLPQHNGCGGLEEYVGDEEDERDDVVSISNQLQIDDHSVCVLMRFVYGWGRVTDPAIAADPRFVLSIKLAQYKTPSVTTSR